MQYLDLDLLENPYGKKVGGGYDTVRVGDGGRLHVRGKDGGPLCMQGRRTTDLRVSEGRVVDCYRCIKILAMESNAPYIRRELTTARGQKKAHFMVPGGRQGQLVADKKASPAGMDGVSSFKRGPSNHPTQPWMTKRTAMAKSYPERLVEEGVALPVGYEPFSPAEEVEVFYYESPKAKRRAAAARRRASAAAEISALANPQHARHGFPYMTFGNPGGSAAGKVDSHENAVALYVFKSGQARSLKDAYAKLRRKDKSLKDADGISIRYTTDYDPRRKQYVTGWYSEAMLHEELMSRGMYNNPQHARHGAPYMTFSNPRYEAYAVLKRGVVIAVVATPEEAKALVRSGQGLSYQSVMWDSERLPVTEVRTNRHARHGFPYMTFGNPKARKMSARETERWMEEMTGVPSRETERWMEEMTGVPSRKKKSRRSRR